MIKLNFSQRIKLDGKKSADEFAEKFITVSYQMIWGPIRISQYLTYGQIMKALSGSDMNRSTWIGMMSPNTMVTKILPGSVPKFIYFSCFSTITWVLILITILLISIIHWMRIRMIKTNGIACTPKRYFKTLVETIINHFAPLLSISLDKNLAEKSSKLSLSVFLLFSMVISINFCNYLLDNFQWKLPVIKINTLEDLALRSSMKIIVRADSSFVAFAEKNDNELSRNIEQQLETYFDIVKDDIENKLVKGLMDGSLAFIHEQVSLVQLLVELEKRNKTFSKDNLHISTESAGYEPYFINFNPETPIWASLALDKM